MGISGRALTWMMQRECAHDQCEYMIGIVNGLLELMDGINGRKGVVVIAKVNDIDDIDPAVLRAGRIDSHIESSPPRGGALLYPAKVSRLGAAARKARRNCCSDRKSHGRGFGVGGGGSTATTT
ncbi:AAA family ATPase [Rhizobium sp. 18055]|uniref:AAA family ATPase n=1 Tax=Rhizobium sp. 18055 TaxID=2681403 RepID=UPI001358B535